MIEIFEADLGNAQDISLAVELIGAYASDPMGQGRPLDPETLEVLASELSSRSWVHIFIARTQSESVGIAVCLQGFSTFNARPLLNVHDVFVKPEFRRNGVARKLFKRIEMKAHMLGCCKITLEVLEGNFGARRAYQQLGFGPYRINDQGGLAEFWQKYI